jgi:non-canonical poly(A) RNA polymerase PAPD5/7
MNAMPPLRPLTFVLKYFMASRGLNQPYTGGVGSFMLQLMIVSFLQHRERDSFNFRRPSLYNLGALLVEFFELYSMDFNYITTGLSVRFDGFYFPKGAKNRKNDFWQENRPFSLSMENPLDPTMDVGKPSFRMQSVQRSFECAHRVLLSHVTDPAVPTDSILGSVLPPTEEMRKRSTITRLKPLAAPRSDPRNKVHSPPRKRQRR